MQNDSNDVNNLSEIYNQGIVKTWWKSTMLVKINSLRQLLGMPERPDAITHHHYDSEVTNKLATVDFGPLDNEITDGISNLSKFFVLTFAGIGFEAAPLIGQGEIHLTGADYQPDCV